MDFMDSQIQDLVDTSREILSQQTGHSSIRWSDDFKKMVIEELSRGNDRRSNFSSPWMGVQSSPLWPPRGPPQIEDDFVSF